ncbi:MAG: bifunctional alpha,alpha-trehalose-phosphate synthase (UDP-forming)/trehalose-phosphatase, partial [Bacteroidales bacterium]
KDTIENLLSKEGCVPVPLTKHQINNYYYGFSNKTLWPLFHYFTQFAEYDESQWNTYIQVNRQFADTLKEHVTDDDKIWIHDYHLFLLPQMIREYLPNADIGFFLHIPFPSYEVFRLLPWREEILQGMLGADLLGFHTYDYERHFMSSVRRQLGYENTYNRIRLESRVMKVDAFPMGIDFEKFHSAARQVHDKTESKPDSKLEKNIREFYHGKGNKKLILSMDRLDYSKGIYNRLMAFEKYLEQHPEQHEKVSLFMLSVPSRTNVEHYQLLKSEIDETVGRINSRFGTTGWMPIWYLFRSMPFEQLIKLYYYSDIALVTPVRDGMNLIAKEYMACRVKHDGVLILSEMAGASKEMGEALIVNPNDLHQIARAIDQAVHMDPEQQKKRNKAMIERLKRYNINHWAQDFMNSWEEIKQQQQYKRAYKIKPLTSESISRLYQKAGSRLLMLDYDGTLVPFYANPDEAWISERVKTIIHKMVAAKKNDVYIVSGRHKDFLDKLFDSNDIGLIAEHGIWIKHPGQTWQKTGEFDTEWKEEIKQILELHADRTPGTFVEEKPYTLTWHFRKADPDLGEKRSWELHDALRDLTGNQNLEVQEGKKILEVKPAGVNKGTAAQELLKQKKYEFIFAIGDDWTDEEMFLQVKEGGATVKVGLEQTEANYYIDTTENVPAFLEKLIRTG